MSWEPGPGPEKPEQRSEDDEPQGNLPPPPPRVRVTLKQTPEKKREPRNWYRRHPVATYGLIGTCVLVFVAANVVLPNLPGTTDPNASLYGLTFSPGNGLVIPGIFSHMFAHANAMHLFVNMLALYFFGPVVERIYGIPRYLLIYFAAGLFAALAQSAIYPDGLLLGASGALMGVLAVFVRYFPRAKLLLYFVIPLPAWLAMVIWLGFNLIGPFLMPRGMAYIAHLGGFAAGMALSYVIPTKLKVKRKHLE
jgi:hypothetical protein